MHWANELIGKPYARGAEGPDAYDCWGLVRHVLRLHYSIAVPAYNAPEDWLEAKRLLEEAAERQHWVKVETMAEGQVVLMARRVVPVHVGVTVRANGRLQVLHCAEPGGVFCQPLAGLQAAGWGRFTHYRHHTCS